MSDLPDWLVASANQGTILFNQSINDGDDYAHDISNNWSIYVYAAGDNLNTPIRLSFAWYTDSSLTVLTQTQTYTSVPLSTFPSALTVEVPVYSPYLVITNLSGQGMDLAVVGSARQLSFPRVLQDASPGRFFSYAGVFTSGTGIDIPHGDGGSDGFSNNAQMWVSTSSGVPGTLVYRYTDLSGGLRDIGIAVLVAGTGFTGFVAMPQGVGRFRFNPTGSSGASSVFVFANPAQL